MVDAMGESVIDVAVGDFVLGMADFAAYPSAGASDYAIMNVWTQVPSGLDLVEAAALVRAGFETTPAIIRAQGERAAASSNSLPPQSATATLGWRTRLR
jgi:hypothetical protein